jgi:hypothetical protein
MKFAVEMKTSSGSTVRASVGFDVEGAERSFEQRGRAFLEVGVRFELVTGAGFRRAVAFVPVSEWGALEARARKSARVPLFAGETIAAEDVLGPLQAVAAVAKSVHVEGQRGCLGESGSQAGAS